MEQKKKYVKITNKGVAYWRCLEIFGLGTKKKNSEKSIARFRSGIKMAIPAAMRLGLEMIISSASEDTADKTGYQYILTFEDFEEIFDEADAGGTEKLLRYKYSNGRIFEPSTALPAFPDWDRTIGSEVSPLYPILREIIANARDEDENYTIEFGVEGVTQAPPGTTAVYVEETPAVLDVLRDNADGYFKFLGAKPILEIPGVGAIYPKSSPDEMRFFACGYLVETDRYSRDSLYDYDIYNSMLFTEHRGLKDRGSYFAGMFKLILGIGLSHFNILQSLIEYAVKTPASYESNGLSTWGNEKMSDEFKAMCRDIWINLFGKKALLSSGDTRIDADAESRGQQVLRFPANARAFFARAGIEDSREWDQKQFSALRHRAATIGEREKFSDVIRRFLWRIKHYRQITDFPLSVFDDSGEALFGHAKDYNTIGINAKQFKADEHELLQIVIHEFRHCMSKVHDSDFRKFMNYADTTEVYLLVILAFALDELEERGVKISEVCADFVDSDGDDFLKKIP